MIRTIVRFSKSLLYYGIGLFLTCLVFPPLVLFGIYKGIKNPLGIFFPKQHNKEPQVAIDGFCHNYLETKSGMHFHYVHEGDENSPLMLCIHGFPECWYSWKHILKQFSSNYYVVACDMRGYGDSDKPNSISKYHITYLVNDIQEIIEALGYQKAVIVAHDWGALIAWSVPCFFPEVVSKLIILNVPNDQGMRDMIRSHPSQLLRSWYIFFFQIPFFPECFLSLNDFQIIADGLQGRNKVFGLKNPSSYLTNDEVEVYKYSAFKHIRNGINYYRARNPIYSGLKLHRVTKQIIQPTLIIWGKEDLFLDHHLAEKSQKYVRNCKVVKIEGASHWVGLEAPEKVREAIENFLKDD